jgi:ribosome-binding protein aMBF1 (putative translation factor)
MAECIKCEISDDKALLFDAISKEGIVKICRKCNLEEQLPLINSVKEEEGIERERNVYNRLAKYAGIDPKEHRRKFTQEGFRREDSSEVENKKLKDLVDENYKSKIPKEKPKRDDLIYNFHWAIMRERRRKKLTQSQLAHELQEPESAIKMIEQGYLPEEGSNKLILKLENYLKINISKKPLIVSDETRYREIDPTKVQIEQDFKENMQFDGMTKKHLTISDLKRMKQEQDKPSSKSISTSSYADEFLDPFEDNNSGKNKKKKWWKRERSNGSEPDLSPEEIERIITGQD